MSNFYTNVSIYGNQILFRGIENGERVKYKIDYQPTLYIKSNKQSKWKTLFDESVEEIKPGSISDTREFIKKYQDVSNFPIYGMTDYVKQFISDTYRDPIHYDKSLIKIYSLDIETTVENGLTVDQMIKNPIEEILLISIMDAHNKKIITFGTKPCHLTDDHGPYIHCQNEAQLLRDFLSYWQSDYPDIATGWNTNGFDFPYIISRMTSILGEDYPKKLSPWNRVRSRVYYDTNGNEKIGYDIEGVALIDYLELFKKFGFTQTENNKLDTVAGVILGENKLENPFKTFKEFYQKDWSLFVAYNRRDALLVDRIEDKMKLLELCMTLSYFSRINFDGVYGPVAMWDSIIYNHLRAKGIVIPPAPKTSKNEQYEGAYVQEPVVGYHKWIASFDLQSLYPHLIMNYNLSAETITEYKLDCTVDQLLNQQIDTTFVHENNLSLTANGWCYRKDVKGFLPELMEIMYADRSKHKKEMLSYEQKLESVKNELKNRNLL